MDSSRYAALVEYLSGRGYRADFTNSQKATLRRQSKTFAVQEAKLYYTVQSVPSIESSDDLVPEGPSEPSTNDDLSAPLLREVVLREDVKRVILENHDLPWQDI
jgi:ClpP class serine protease